MKRYIKSDTEDISNIDARDLREVAKNPATRPTTLWKLVKNYSGTYSWEIRAAVARNPNCPIELLNYIFDEYYIDPDVVMGVAKNLNIDTALINKIVDTLGFDDMYWETWYILAKNLNTPALTLAKLAWYPYDLGVRQQACENPNTPKEVVEDLKSQGYI